MVPSGRFTARATDGVWGESKNKGTPFVRVSFKIVGGPADGQFVTWDGYFTEATQERTLESLRHCGCAFPGDDVTNLEGIDNQDVSITVEHEKYTPESGDKAGIEQTRARVAWVNSLGGGIPTEQQMTDAKKKAFAARLKGAVVMAKKGTAVSSPNRNGAAKPAASRQLPEDMEEPPF